MARTELSSLPLAALSRSRYRDPRRSDARQPLDDLAAALRLEPVLLDHVRAVFGHDQLLTEIGCVEIRSMCQQLLRQRLLQYLDGHVVHEVSLKDLPHEALPFRAEIIRLHPQHLRRRIRRETDAFQRNVEPGDLEEFLEALALWRLGLRRLDGKGHEGGKDGNHEGLADQMHGLSFAACPVAR